MNVSTDIPAFTGLLTADKQSHSNPILKPSKTYASATTSTQLEEVKESTPADYVIRPPRVGASMRREVVSNSAPAIEIWRGVVQTIDRAAGTMSVYLDAMMSGMPRHTADIDLEWVSPQDEGLLVPGAVFYLTLFKRTNPSVENAQELRFRRMPFWTSAQVDKVARDAEMIGAKLKELPRAE